MADPKDARAATALGAAMKKARKRLGLMQHDVSRIVGLHSEVYGRYERGKQLPSLPTFIALCSALQVKRAE